MDTKTYFTPEATQDGICSSIERDAKTMEALDTELLERAGLATDDRDDYLELLAADYALFFGVEMAERAKAEGVISERFYNLVVSNSEKLLEQSGIDC